MLSITGAKVIAMVGLGGGSFLLGILPLCFSRSRHVYPVSMSASLCFGAGVLLATSIVHMLPDVREELPEYAEPVFCAGFLLLYFVDEIVHYFWTDSIDTLQSLVHHSSSTPSCSHARPNHSHTLGSHVPDYGSTGKIVDHCQADSTTSLLCHTTFKEPCPNSTAGRIGLIIALTLHTILEGLAIGLQDSSSKVMLLVGAVACHKLVVALCLGIELSTDRSSTCRHVSQMALFSIGCAAGIGIGMGISQIQDTWTVLAIPILQGIAGGTLLYVTVCEVLPRERAKWHHQTQRRAAGLVQFLSVAIGFSLILVLNILFVHTDNEAQPIVDMN